MPNIRSLRPIASAEQLLQLARATTSKRSQSAPPSSRVKAPEPKPAAPGAPALRSEIGITPCPALNAAWRRGLLPENGQVTKDILVTALSEAYGTSSALGGFLAGRAVSLYQTPENPGTFNLRQLHDPQQRIEHRGSLVRPDADGGLGKLPNRALFDQLASFSQDGVTLTRKELASAEKLRLWQTDAPARANGLGLGELGLAWEVLKRPGPDGSDALHLADLESFFMNEELPAAYAKKDVGLPGVLANAALAGLSQLPFVGNARGAANAKWEETKDAPYPIGRPKL
jgi:hypothetical protein